MTNRRKLPTLGLLLLALAVVAGLYLLGLRVARQAEKDLNARQLQIIRLDLESILERYESLPFALSFQTEAALALRAPGQGQWTSHVNAVLQNVQRQAKVAAVYLMDTRGNTIASSNWDTPQSYIGKNFGFRPYFQQALQGHTGRFYGVGSTTAEPGYFIAQPVYATPQRAATAMPLGVVAVKISLNDIADGWSRFDATVALVDHWGVIFLSNRAPWQYRTINPLGPPALEEIAATRQYDGKSIIPLTALPSAQRAGFGPAEMHSVGRLGWQLMVFPDQRAITRVASRWAVTGALLLALAVLSLWALHQRKRRLEERDRARLALQEVVASLDRQIADRTSELTSANQSLAAKYRKLEEAQKLLQNTQDSLVQAGKLAMLGQMAAGMTHELNQPLTAIRAFSDNALTFLGRGQVERVQQNLAHISAASERMGIIVAQMKEFARKSDAPLAAVDLSQVMQSALHLLQHDLDRSACVLHWEARTPVQVLGDALRIEQVLINLLRNAMDAAEASEAKTIWVDIARENGTACVRIRDSGTGLPEAVASRLFEPFFTTKPPGKGLGLGLAISSSIVEAMNGSLTAHNSVSGGAEFELRLSVVNADSFSSSHA